MSSRPGIGIVLKRLLTVAILGSLFVISGMFVTYMALRGRTVEVPNVMGKSKLEAEDLLEDNGLRMKVINDKEETDIVSDQSPAPGTIVKTGQQVRVSLSLVAAPPASKKGKQGN